MYNNQPGCLTGEFEFSSSSCSCSCCGCGCLLVWVLLILLLCGLLFNLLGNLSFDGWDVLRYLGY